MTSALLSVPWESFSSKVFSDEATLDNATYFSCSKHTHIFSGNSGFLWNTKQVLSRIHPTKWNNKKTVLYQINVWFLWSASQHIKLRWGSLTSAHDSAWKHEGVHKRQSDFPNTSTTNTLHCTTNRHDCVSCSSHNSLNDSTSFVYSEQIF